MSIQVWLLRPMPHGTNQMKYFLENNRIAVGYPVGTELSRFSYKDIKKLLVKHDWEGGIGNVNRLVHLMRVGDIVVVPDDNARDVYFGKVTSDYIYVPELDVDQAGTGFPHQREVEWFFDKKPVPRNELPDALLDSLRYPGAVAELTKHLPIISEFLGFNVDAVPYQSVSNSSWDDLSQKAFDFLNNVLDSGDVEEGLKAAEIILRFAKK
jgi:restriction system protein